MLEEVDGKACQQTSSLMEIIPEDMQPKNVSEAGLADQAFTKMIRHYFEGKSKPDSHIALAEVDTNIGIQLPQMKPQQ